jgi:hypothetical protein
MSNTINYTNRTTPAFDAVVDIQEWMGKDRWNKISPEMAKVRNREQFALYASLAGVHGFPVKAWYELYHGQGSWRDCDAES